LRPISSRIASVVGQLVEPLAPLVLVADQVAGSPVEDERPVRLPIRRDDVGMPSAAYSIALIADLDCVEHRVSQRGDADVEVDAAVVVPDIG
jgi:hypothetical protein